MRGARTVRARRLGACARSDCSRASEWCSCPRRRTDATSRRGSRTCSAVRCSRVRSRSTSTTPRSCAAADCCRRRTSSTVRGRHARARCPRRRAVGAATPSDRPRSTSRSSRRHDAEVVELVPPDPATVDLAEAARIAAGGAGLGGPEPFAVLQRVAIALGASYGASRVAADAGWVPQDRFIGTTGVAVDPDALHRVRHLRRGAARVRTRPPRPHHRGEHRRERTDDGHGRPGHRDRRAGVARRARPPIGCGASVTR